MSRNSTGNPIGSSAFLDFEDNVKNLDVAVNSTVPLWVDRFGNERLTLPEYDRLLRDALANSEYVIVGDYAPGITITNYNQLLRDSSGELWRLSAIENIPYTTTGAGLPESGAFVNVGDAALRQEIGDFAATQYFNSVAGMISTPLSSNIKYAVVKSYTGSGNSGGGIFKFNPAGTGTDSGWNIAGISGGAWERLTGDRTLEDYGISSGTMTPSQIRSAINSGNISKIDSDISIASFVAGIDFTNIDLSHATVNGASLFSKNLSTDIYAEYPDDFPIQIPFKARYFGGKVVTSLDVSDFDQIKTQDTDIIYYVDPVGGSNSNSGTTEDLPLQTMRGVFDAEFASGLSPRSVGVMAKPGFYPRAGGWMDAPRKPYYDLTIIPWEDGDIEMWSADNTSTLTYSLVGDNTYSTSRSATTYVVDRSKRNSYGDYTVYDKVDSIAECRSTKGSFFIDGSTVYVHCFDDRVPDQYIMLTIGAGSLIDSTLTSSFSIYCRNVAFFGGTHGALFSSTDTASSIKVYLDKCKAMYSSGNAFYFRGIELSIVNDCLGAYCFNDIYNYHSEIFGAGGKACVAYEINSHGYAAGLYNPAQNNNLSTAHDYCVVARFGTSGRLSHGPGIIDVHDSFSYNFCCNYGDSVGTTDNYSFVISSQDAITGNNKAWYDSCYSNNGIGGSLRVGGNAQAYIRNCDFKGVIYGANGINPFPTQFNFPV